MTSVWITLISNHQIVQQESLIEITKVKFAKCSYQQIEAYVNSNEPFGKAGGYGIQGLGATLITGIEGCFYNVWGFPVHAFSKRLSDMLAKLV